MCHNLVQLRHVSLHNVVPGKSGPLVIDITHTVAPSISAFLCVSGAAPTAATQSKGRGGLDLLGDLGGDPFASPTSNTAARKQILLFLFFVFVRLWHVILEVFLTCCFISAPGGGFADFANFGGGGGAQPQQNAAFPQSQSGRGNKAF